MNVKNILIPVANGSEEIETVTLFDVFKRAGAEVALANCSSEGAEKSEQLLTLSRGLKIVADCSIEECRERNFDLIVLPGGMPGAEILAHSNTLVELLRRHRNSNNWIGAICASPAVFLVAHGILAEKMTCHPAFQDRIPSSKLQSTSRVVVDPSQKVVTSQGPGTALEFSLALVEILMGKSKRHEIAIPMIV